MVLDGGSLWAGKGGSHYSGKGGSLYAVFALDGNPGVGVIQGMIIEFVLGFLAIFGFFKYREKS